MQKFVCNIIIGEGYSFVACLDLEFAKKYATKQMSQHAMVRMNQIGTNFLKNIQIPGEDPYYFYENSCLLKQIYLGEQGISLAADKPYIQRVLEIKPNYSLEYHTHNINSSGYGFALVGLFSKWIEFIDFFSER